MNTKFRKCKKFVSAWSKSGRSNRMILTYAHNFVIQLLFALKNRLVHGRKKSQIIKFTKTKKSGPKNLLLKVGESENSLQKLQNYFFQFNLLGYF